MQKSLKKPKIYFAERVKAESKVEVWQRNGQDLAIDLEGTKKLLYNIAKNYRKGNSDASYSVLDGGGNTLLVETDEITNRWKEYFLVTSVLS